MTTQKVDQVPHPHPTSTLAITYLETDEEHTIEQVPGWSLLEGPTGLE